MHLLSRPYTTRTLRQFALNSLCIQLTPVRAYEIKTLHGREPPPIDILERMTAKGGDILNRTVENYKQPQKNGLANGDSDSGDDAKTPKEEKMDIDEPGSLGRTRGE